MNVAGFRRTVVAEQVKFKLAARFEKRRLRKIPIREAANAHDRCHSHHGALKVTSPKRRCLFVMWLQQWLPDDGDSLS